MSFLAPAFLAGLLAIGLPLWLHRLSAENPNRKPFSSVMFLEAGEPQRVMARQLQYFLLLAFRIAVIVALVLAFLQPAIWRSPAAAAAGEQRLHVVVVDTSASMSAGDRWDDALDAAVDIIDAAPIADPVQVIAAGRVLEVVTGSTLDKTEARQGVRSLEPGVFFVDYGQLTRALDGVLRTAELPVVLHFVTDAQATGLPTRFADLAPAEPVEIEIHTVGEPEPNWAVDSLFGSALTGELAATVTSHADEAEDLTLTLELDGDVVERQSLSLEPGQQAVVEFAPLSLAAGANRVQVVMTPGDALEADNLRMLALNRPEPHPVLIVSGELTGTGDTRFLTDAMGVVEGLALEPEAVTASELRDRDFDEYEFVVVSDAAVLGDADAERLGTYVEAGGGLLLALGPRSASLIEVPVTGHEFQGQTSQFASAPAAPTIGTIVTDHPALAGLDTLRAARFSRHAAIEETAEDEVLIRLENGDPLLIERSLGNGRLLLWTSSLDRSWNELPKAPVFVPFVAGISDHLLGGAGFTNEAALGSTLALAAMGMSGGQIFAPDGESVLGLGGAGTDVLLDRIGFYELVGGGRAELVAVNFDARESDLAQAPDATLARWQELGRAAAEAADSAAAGVVQEDIQVPLGYWLLILLLAVAVVETGIGNWHLRVRRGIAA